MHAAKGSKGEPGRLNARAGKYWKECSRILNCFTVLSSLIWGDQRKPLTSRWCSGRQINPPEVRMKSRCFWRVCVCVVIPIHTALSSCLLILLVTRPVPALPLGRLAIIKISVGPKVWHPYCLMGSMYLYTWPGLHGNESIVFLPLQAVN